MIKPLAEIQQTQNITAFQKARDDVGLSQARVHDLRHTYGQRLRDADVSKEDRALLRGHTGIGMPQHYATATVARLLEAANAMLKNRDRTKVLRVWHEDETGKLDTPRVAQNRKGQQALTC